MIYYVATPYWSINEYRLLLIRMVYYKVSCSKIVLYVHLPWPQQPAVLTLRPPSGKVFSVCLHVLRHKKISCIMTLHGSVQTMFTNKLKESITGRSWTLFDYQLDIKHFVCEPPFILFPTSKRRRFMGDDKPVKGSASSFMKTSGFYLGARPQDHFEKISLFPVNIHSRLWFFKWSDWSRDFDEYQSKTGQDERRRISHELPAEISFGSFSARPLRHKACNWWCRNLVWIQSLVSFFLPDPLLRAEEELSASAGCRKKSKMPSALLIWEHTSASYIMNICRE